MRSPSWISPMRTEMLSCLYCDPVEAMAEFIEHSLNLGELGHDKEEGVRANVDNTRV